MRITILFLLLVSLTSTRSQSILDDGNTWYISTTVLTTHTSVYMAKGDTMVDGRHYAKIYSCDTTGFCPFLYYLLREDSGRVYYKLGTNDDRILFDFNLVVGDTFKIDWWSPWDALIVTDVDTTTIKNGDQRLRLTLSRDSYPAVTWIEGIGGTKGLIEFEDLWTADVSHRLRCVFHDEEHLFGSLSNCFENTVGISESDPQSFEIHPNPASRYLTIVHPEHTGRFDIKDLQGKTRLTGNLTSGGQTQILLPNLTDGIYVLTLYSDVQGRSTRLFTARSTQR